MAGADPGRSGAPYGGGDPGDGNWTLAGLFASILPWKRGSDTERKVYTAIGIGALVGAIVLVVAPWLPVWLVGPFLPLLLLANQPGIIFLALVAGSIGLWSVYRSADPRDRYPSIRLPTLPDDREAELGADVAGERLDTLVGRVTGEADNPSTGVNRAVDRRQVRKKLRDAASDVLRERHDLALSETQNRLDDGTWTRSRRAAAFLGGPEAPQPTLDTRIRDWASGAPFERRVHATVDEIVRHAEVDHDGWLLDVPIDPIEHGPSGDFAPDLRTTADQSDSSGPNFDLDAPGGVTEAEIAGFDDGTDRDWSGIVDEDSTDAAGATGDGDETTASAESDDDFPDEWVSPGDEEESVRETEGGEST